MEHDYRHLSTEFDMDAWLDATDELLPGNHSANDVQNIWPFVHMIGPSGDTLLRQWSEGTTPERVSAIARVLDAMSTGVGDVIPVVSKHPQNADSVTTIVRNRVYSAQNWLPGRPLGRFGGYKTPAGEAVTLPLPETAHANEVINQVAAAIAKAHLASESVDHSQLPIHTVGMMMSETRKFWSEHRPILGDKAAGERDIRRWLRCGNRIVPTASDLIRNDQESRNEANVVLHNNLWPEHILIEGHDDARVLTGIVGWSHMAVGSPVLDIAQMVIHMQGWSAALTESIIDNYVDHRHLRPDQRRLIPAVAGLILVQTVGKLLMLSYVDQDMIGHEATPVIRSGMKTMLDSLERVTQILAPDIERTERMNRQRRESDAGKWDYNRPAPRKSRARLKKHG